MTDQPRPPLRDATTLTAAVTVAGGLCYAATFSRAPPSSPFPHVYAGLLVLVATLPPLWFPSLFPKASVGPLAVTLWRVTMLMPCYVFLKTFEGSERNYFIIALLACYFVALPLESRSLIRRVQQLAKSDDQ